MTIRGANYERMELDSYSTPVYVIRNVLPHIVLRDTVVDPCSGKGNVLRALRRCGGKRAIGFDIKRGHDFLVKPIALTIRTFVKQRHRTPDMAS